MKARFVAAAMTFILLPGCGPDGADDVARRERGPGQEESEAPHKEGRIRKRKATGPRKARVFNHAFGDAARLTRRAIADLKEMGYWDDLTKRIYAVRISSRERTVPVDAHLGDSLWTYYRDDETGELGDLCDVLLFTKSIKDDVARQEIYHLQGRLAHPPPSVAQFWTVLLAHEIAHCTERGQRGERFSTRWETRILEGYGIDRVGTP